MLADASAQPMSAVADFSAMTGEPGARRYACLISPTMTRRMIAPTASAMIDPINQRRRCQAVKNVGISALIFCLFLSAAWANLAIVYQLPGSAGVSIGVCLALNVIALAALVEVVLRRRWWSRFVLIYAVTYAIFLAWVASHHRVER
jgi:hypothetical protein